MATYPCLSQMWHVSTATSLCNKITTGVKKSSISPHMERWWLQCWKHICYLDPAAVVTNLTWCWGRGKKRKTKTNNQLQRLPCLTPPRSLQQTRRPFSVWHWALFMRSPFIQSPPVILNSPSQRVALQHLIWTQEQADMHTGVWALHGQTRALIVHSGDFHVNVWLSLNW